MGPDCGGGSVANTNTSTEAVTALSEAELEPVALSSASDTMSMTSAVNALVAQIIDETEAELQQDIYDRMGEAQSSALEIVPADSEDTQVKTENQNDAGANRGKSETDGASAASVNDTSAASRAQETAHLQIQPTLQSALFASAVKQAIATPEDAPTEAVKPTTSI